MMKKAKIFINDHWAGVLTEDHDGYHFEYTSDYLKMEGATPLSPTMPLQAEALTVLLFARRLPMLQAFLTVSMSFTTVFSTNISLQTVSQPVTQATQQIAHADM